MKKNMQRGSGLRKLIAIGFFAISALLQFLYTNFQNSLYQERDKDVVVIKSTDIRKVKIQQNSRNSRENRILAKQSTASTSVNTIPSEIVASMVEQTLVRLKKWEQSNAKHFRAVNKLASTDNSIAYVQLPKLEFNFMHTLISDAIEESNIPVAENDGTERKIFEEVKRRIGRPEGFRLIGIQLASDSHADKMFTTDFLDPKAVEMDPETGKLKLHVNNFIETKLTNELSNHYQHVFSIETAD